MILILSASSRISDAVAKSYRLQRSEYRHVFDEDQLRGLEGLTLWVTPSAYRLRHIQRTLDAAKAFRLNIVEKDINREQSQ